MATDPANKHILVPLDPATHAALKWAAWQERRSITNYLQWLIAAELERRRLDPSVPGRQWENATE